MDLDITKIGIIGTILVVVIGGTVIYLEPTTEKDLCTLGGSSDLWQETEIKDLYYCQPEDVYKWCGKLSLSKKTCYLYKEVEVEKTKDVLTKEMFPVLLENENSLTWGRAVFEFNNIFGFEIPKEKLSNYFSFGSEYIKGCDYKIEKNISYPVEKVNYNETETCKTTYTPNMTEMKTCEKKAIVDKKWTEYEIKQEYVNFDSIPIGKSKIELYCNLTTMYGPKKIEWVPKVEYYTGVGFERKDWALWGNGWSMRRQINITNPQGNYSIPMNLTYGTHYNASDCSDIRFTNMTDNEELDYWVEVNTSANNCYVWVETRQSGNYYLYYDNTTPVQSTSNIANAFVYGIDWTAQTSMPSPWLNTSQVTYTFSTTTGISTTIATPYVAWVKGMYLNMVFKPPFAVRTIGMVATSAYSWTNCIVTAPTSINAIGGNGDCYEARSSAWGIEPVTSGGTGGGTYGGSFTLNSPYTIEAIYSVNIQNITMNGTLQVSRTDANQSAVYISHTALNDVTRTFKMQQSIIRNYILPEPTYSIGNEEQPVVDSTPPKWYNIVENKVDPSIYSTSPNYGFQVNCTDETEMGTPLFENNVTGSLENISMSGGDGGIYYANITSMAAGVLDYSFICIDAAGNQNRSDSNTFTVNPAPLEIYQWGQVVAYNNTHITYNISVIVLNNKTETISNIKVTPDTDYGVSYNISSLVNSQAYLNISVGSHIFARGVADAVYTIDAPSLVSNNYTGTGNMLQLINPIDPPSAAILKGGPSDSCTPPGSGNWEIDCKDNCSKSSDTITVIGDIIIYSTSGGNVSFLNSNLTYVKRILNATDICYINLTCSEGVCIINATE